MQLVLNFFNKGGCLVSGLSAAHARLHWVQIYIVAVMKYKSVEALCRVCYDFSPDCLIWHCSHPYMVIIACIS